ncbi:iron chelate uptake ABC transporter family permease subunit [Roseomonas sp. 18066]|uniref:iron chelate uptake ABC transporter family permease subunit n=1 Tax=Roseomonas sp. 18066 TaxID=2681412 RepID=UPI00135CCD5F|nr:iron chelate uptake ABC transporter family permease subunit [Roseomonas sp. 18066]
MTRRGWAVALLALALGFVGLSLGRYPTPPAAVLATLLGGGDAAQQLVILEWRLPRVLAALLLGAALGVSGAILQALSRNPLGSPDLVGIDAGAFAGMLLAGPFPGALLGGALAMLAAQGLAGGAGGLRFVLTGVGLAAMLNAFNSWVLAGAQLEVAAAAAAWAGGTLDGMEPAQLWLLGLALPLLGGALLLQRSLGLLALGDDVARGLGLPVRRARGALLALSAALTILATACAGPIGFVALAAPSLAQLATGGTARQLAPVAAMGALLLVAADLLATHLFAPVRLPVGRVTLACGGAWLLWRLLRR